MIKIFLNLRLKQIVRALKEVGLFRILFFLPFFGLILFVTLNFVRQGQHMTFIAIMMGFSVLTTHLKRGDKTFMKALQWPSGWVFGVEYVISLSPFLIAYAFSPAPYFVAILAGFAMAVAWIPLTWVKKQRNFLRRIPLIPAYAFEWKSGLRQYGLVILIFYSISLGFSWEPAVAPIFLVLFSLLTCTFYLHGEPLEMVESLRMGGRQLIWLKVRTQLLIFWTLSLPFLVLMFVQLWQFWPVIIYAVVICSSLQIIAILYKYALYTPNSDLKRNMLFIGLATISFFIPPMVPVPIFLIIRNWPKSIHNLNHHLYA